MDKYTEMAVFSKAADLGSFSAAARELDLTPSAVSKLITRLEDRLGARLFQRTTRKLNLTAEGLAFRDRCSSILVDIQEAEDAVMALHDKVSGTLRVTAISAFARIQMIKLMPEFMARHPDLRVELELSEREVDLVGEGVDVAVLMSEGLSDESLVSRRLAINRRVICASPNYLEEHGTPLTPDELLHHNCLIHSSLQPFNDWEFSENNRIRALRVHGNFHSNSGSALHEAVKSGLGIARLATFVVQPDIESGRLIPLLTEHTHNSSSILLAYPHRRHLSNKVRAFADYMVEKFTPVPPWEKTLYEKLPDANLSGSSSVVSKPKDPTAVTERLVIK
ncbi:MAG: LysR family transcriptional regulator [Granulosicoccus sp.]|nr:LysR family transcriptional regulator [Granulosicoccus sp.]